MRDGEGFAFFYWHRCNRARYASGMCAYRCFDGYCLKYWAMGPRGGAPR